jgi:hypothetical protein
MLWSQVKKWVASRNVTFKTEDVKLLCEQKFDDMRGREWHPVCDHVKRTEKGYLQTEGLHCISVYLSTVIMSTHILLYPGDLLFTLLVH